MKKSKMEEKKRPNIVLVIIDAFRPKHLSLFGYKKETDKNLKKLAKESVLFKQAISTSNSTVPSLNSIFTGLYPPNHGVIHQFPYTTEKEIDKFEGINLWMPSFLKNLGYETIAIDWLGMWYKKGFDYYEEKEDKKTLIQKIISSSKTKQILLKLPNWAYKLGKTIFKSRSSTAFTPSRETTKLVISKIKEAKKPFFLFAHFWDTHFPFPTTKYSGSKNKDIDKILGSVQSDSQKEYIKKRITDIKLESSEDIVNKYDLTIKNIDKGIGKIIKFLKKKKIWENTIFMVMGDHGDSLTEHKIYFSHSGLFEETIHVPLIIHLPEIPQKETSKLIQNVDIFPTIAEILGEKINENIDGVSAIPLVKYDIPVRDKTFSWDGLSQDIKCVRTKKRKLIIAEDEACNLCKYHHHERIEEYDLEKDPEESKNIFNGKSELSKSFKESKV